jgi:hypothetical protein
MPQYLDYHEKAAAFSPQALETLVTFVKDGRRDRFGTLVVNTFVGSNGQGWCHSEAPNPEAVVKSHQLLGVSQDAAHVIEVRSIV